MTEGFIDSERILATVRARVLGSSENIAEVMTGKQSMLVLTSQRDLTVSRPNWVVRGEAWVDDVFAVEGPAWMTHVEPEIFGVVYAKDGSAYVLGLYGEDDLVALASRLILPAGQAVGAVALAELIALHGVRGHFHGALVEGSVWGKPLAERYPEAGVLAARLHPVQLERDGDRVRVEFFSYTRRPVDLNTVVVVERWSVDAAPGRVALIGREKVAQVKIGLGDLPL